MQLRQSNGDVRLSVSSAPSCSSHGSGQDDIESLGDVYVWGEIWCSGILSDGSAISCSSKTDVLLPRPLESNVVLDVRQIACGDRHAALVTRQGEVFTWGEESGGRLGHGSDADCLHPQLVEALAVHNMDCVACGTHHTCAISCLGELFSWGDGTFSAGILGHGADISYWIPKRVCGSLEGLQVLSVSCGTWHSALVTSSRKLFTFGDGSFGVLGHGDRESVLYPREVESLSEMKVVKVACGVYHTAAIMEVMGLTGGGIFSGKLFTWGDNDKFQLGHGDRESRLVPTCVSSLLDYNFHQLACGNTITVALTTSGHVFTMGNTIYGQLGNPQSDGRVPCLVQDKLVGESVEEISCGAFHVAVLTSRSEVFTWGNGANGRLGHGDVEDRKTPILVEALRDRHVKSISCGSNFTACICIHKWVSGADQSLCSGCCQAFGFTRKRHNCYNCGLVHCHACSSKKVLKAALAPTPGKPHRVCDLCYAKLKASESATTSIISKKNMVSRRSIDNRERADTKSGRVLLSSNMESVKFAEVKSVKQGAKYDSPLIRASQVPSLLQLRDITFPGSLSALQTALKPIVTSQPVTNSRPASPYSRKISPPRSATPAFSKSIIDSLKKTNELLNQEVLRLQAQVKYLKQKCDIQDIELCKREQKKEELNLLAPGGLSVCAAAMEAARSVENGAAKIPPGADEIGKFQDNGQAEVQTHSGQHAYAYDPVTDVSEPALCDKEAISVLDQRVNDAVNGAGVELSHSSDEGTQNSVRPFASDAKEAMVYTDTEGGSRSPKMSRASRNAEDKQVMEQFEPGVYVNLIQLHSGAKIFRRVRFSKKRFNEQQAEKWWKENEERVLMRYNCRGKDGCSSGIGLGGGRGLVDMGPGNNDGPSSVETGKNTCSTEPEGEEDCRSSDTVAGFEGGAVESDDAACH